MTVGASTSTALARTPSNGHRDARLCTRGAGTARCASHMGKMSDADTGGGCGPGACPASRASNAKRSAFSLQAPWPWGFSRTSTGPTTNPCRASLALARAPADESDKAVPYMLSRCPVVEAAGRGRVMRSHNKCRCRTDNLHLEPSLYEYAVPSPSVICRKMHVTPHRSGVDVPGN